MRSDKKPIQDLTGQKFGLLTVESFSHYTAGRHPYWNCRCECGNTKAVCVYNLRAGNTKSCGCLKVRRGKTLNRDTAIHYGGTQIEILAAKTTKRTNTSGFRGVSWVERTNKWRVCLTLRGVKYHLGYYTDFDEAVAARCKGEERVENFIYDDYAHHTPSDVAEMTKQALRDRVQAKEKAEAEFKRVICNHRGYGLIPIQSVVSGDIKTDEHLIVAGTVTGDVHCGKRVMINGTVQGNITAEIVYLPHGKVEGNITAQHIFCSHIRGQIFGRAEGMTSPYTRITSL